MYQALSKVVSHWVEETRAVVGGVQYTPCIAFIRSGVYYAIPIHGTTWTHARVSVGLYQLWLHYVVFLVRTQMQVNNIQVEY